MGEHHCNDTKIETNGNEHENQRDIIEIHIREHDDRNHEEMVDTKRDDQQLLVREALEETGDTNSCTNREDN